MPGCTTEGYCLYEVVLDSCNILDIYNFTNQTWSVASNEISFATLLLVSKHREYRHSLLEFLELVSYTKAAAVPSTA